MRRALSILALVLVLAGVDAMPGSAQAGPVPQQIRYQGRLLTSTGAPASGALVLTVRLYEVATGATGSLASDYVWAHLSSPGTTSIVNAGGIQFDTVGTSQNIL